MAQTVAAAFTAEERDKTRKIVGNLKVAWKKQYKSTITFFTIGTSSIGGTDVIPYTGASYSDWNRYYYFDESNQLTGLSYERELQVPTGGIAKALAEAKLDNTSGRYLPRSMGGSSELYTAVQKPRRPMIINAGFNYSGIDNMIPQFVGITSKTAEVVVRDKQTTLSAEDFLGYLQNRYLDQEVMFTSKRTDEVIETILQNLGYSTAQYDLDYGINLIPFGLFETGSKYTDVINKLVQAEYGHFYQDEQGKLRFENRQHWTNSPYTQVQRILYTSQVLDAKQPDDHQIINVVEVKAKPRAKQPNQLVFTLSGPITLAASASTEYWINFDDPMLSIDTPVYVANTASDASGTDSTASVTNTIYKFAKSAKIKFNNTLAYPVYITAMTIYGRPAKVYQDVYARVQDDSSVTAYEERHYQIENEYIGDALWANQIGQMIVDDFSEPQNLQEITIRAIPELQMGDLVSWQGRYWRIFGIKTSVSPGTGFVQTLKLLQRTIATYFRIGISTIGGSDKIAP
jgi:hypothetical protein